MGDFSHLVTEAALSWPWMEDVPPTSEQVVLQTHYSLSPVAQMRPLRPGTGRDFSKDLLEALVSPYTWGVDSPHPFSDPVSTQCFKAELRGTRKVFRTARTLKSPPDPCKDGPSTHWLRGICSFPDFAILFSACLMTHRQSTVAGVPAWMLSWWPLPTSDLGQESSAPSTQGMTDRPALLEPQCSHV